MSNKVCRFCKVRPPSSKEHVIADSRLRQIKSFKPDSNDNIQRTFKGITCEECNNFLGDTYESHSPFHLAYATIWKVLAGNVNNAFNRLPDFQLNNTSSEAIEKAEAQLLSHLNKPELCLPEITFEFDLDALEGFSESSNAATKKLQINIVDENGHPIQGAVTALRDKAGGEEERGYSAETNALGRADLEVLMRLELVRSVSYNTNVQNLDSGERFTKKSDAIVYVSQAANARRLLVLLPINSPIQTNWANARIEISEPGFLPLVQENFPDLKIKAIRPYFDPSELFSK